MGKVFVTILSACFLVSAGVAAEQHGPRAGQLMKAGDVLIEVVAHDAKSASVHILEQNWGDKDITPFSIQMIPSAASKPKPFACQKDKFRFVCDLSKIKEAKSVLLELYQDKRKVGVANLSIPLKTVSQMAPVSTE